MKGQLKCVLLRSKFMKFQNQNDRIRKFHHSPYNRGKKYICGYTVVDMIVYFIGYIQVEILALLL